MKLNERFSKWMPEVKELLVGACAIPLLPVLIPLFLVWAFGFLILDAFKILREKRSTEN